MNKWSAHCLPLLALPLMVACGGGSTGGFTPSASAVSTPGALLYPATAPAGQVSLSAAQFKANLTATTSGQQLYALATGGAAGATLPCGVEVHKLEFYTKGGGMTPETIHSSGALMVPTGAGCTGPRPIVLYAHGTTTDKSYDISALQLPANPANSESALIATLFASNGFIVVAPNYAGYDDSTLSYHPYLNASQQAGEMADALIAARAALPLIGTVSDLGLLYVTGYSQGGHVAMATVRHLEANAATYGPVRASAPLSGPYALGAFGDALFAGNVDIGATLFVPLLSTSYQHAYGNLYTQTSDIYAPQFASGIDTLLPSQYSETQLFTQGLLPQTALFNSAPSGPFAFLAAAQFQNPGQGGFGMGTTFLVNDATRASYLADAQTNPDPALTQPPSGILPAPTAASPIRAALIRNDLRAQDGGSPGFWRPHSPMLLCAGGADPVVFSVNTKIISGYFGAAPASVAGSYPLPLVLNMDPGTGSRAALSSSPGLDTLFGALEAAFGATAAADATANGLQQAQIDYHGNVAPFCTAAALQFFHSNLP
ncbi:MAG: alpha/beta hydrolase [Pseudomonadota bacterium]|nr:alpha/beta hydrolase [Pseudomonadota bacterium]